MLGFAFIGFRLEKEFGYLRIGVLYVLSGIGGSILSSLFIRTTISVGASGALFGLLGAMLSELLTNWTIYANKAIAHLRARDFNVPDSYEENCKKEVMTFRHHIVHDPESETATYLHHLETAMKTTCLS
ncbi:rhomboid-like protein 1 [Tanacetum coccineum]